MNKKVATLNILIFLIFGVSICASAQSTDYDFLTAKFIDNEIYSTLKSLSVNVSVKNAPLLDNKVESQIKTDAEARLRQAGFSIQKKEYPSISIEIKSIYSGTSLSYFIVEVSFVEKFLLERNKSVSRIERLWSKSEKVFPSNVEENTFNNIVGSLIDKFTELCTEIKKESEKSSVQKVNEIQINQDNSTFTETYVGGNRPPEVEVYNDSDRTLYLNLGQGNMTAYTIPSKTSLKITLEEGSYDFKATAPRVLPVLGQRPFRKGYRYVWRFTIIKR